MTTYKLTYFPVKALGEPIRFLLNYGGLEFEDFRVQKDQWPEYKSNMPFGQVPVLEVDGKLAHQSVAIARYLAKQMDLVGENDWEDLEIDMIVDTVNDVRSRIVAYSMEKDEEKKEAVEKNLFEDSLPFFLKKLDTVAEENDA